MQGLAKRFDFSRDALPEGETLARFRGGAAGTSEFCSLRLSGQPKWELTGWPPGSNWRTGTECFVARTVPGASNIPEWG